MRRLTSVLAILFLALPLLAGCGDGATSGSGSETAGDAGDGATTRPGKNATTEDPETGVIPIEIEGGEVTTKAERVRAAAGEPVELLVRSDTAGELHVHSTPEQVLAYGVGTTSLKLTIDRPGVVDVEDHELEVVVVQLEVS